jgi:hypothetical protein
MWLGQSPIEPGDGRLVKRDDIGGTQQCSAIVDKSEVSQGAFGNFHRLLLAVDAVELEVCPERCTEDPHRLTAE